MSAVKNKNFLATKSVALASLAIFVASCGATSNAAAEINGRKISRTELEQTVTELGEAGQTPVVDGEIDGDDAHCETYYTFIGANIATPHLLSMGRYIDHLQRRDGIWKYANRVTVIEKNFELTEYPDDEKICAGDTATGPLLHAARDASDLSYDRPVVPRRPD